MGKIRIGIICPSEIAYRRFMPAISKCGCAEYAGVASADRSEWFGDGTPDLAVIEREAEKARRFADTYGGEIFGSYGELLDFPGVDAVYLPLPPALHFRWATEALKRGKHVLVEKPCTTSARDTKELLELAASLNLAVHENYMFTFHKQIGEIKEIIGSGAIGDVTLYRITFGFPRRAESDFRYRKSLGGGALLDCGGYTLKLADMLLGDDVRTVYARLDGEQWCDTDIRGSAALIDGQGVTAQVAFGMDNGYRCELEAWGSEGTLRTGRIMTAPDGFVPTAEITARGEKREVTLSADDAFGKSIEKFCECVRDPGERERNRGEILRQAILVEEVRQWK